MIFLLVLFTGIALFVPFTLQTFATPVSTQTVITPVGNKIFIGVDANGGLAFNGSEIDVSLNTNYTIVFVNQQSTPHDLTILKPGAIITSTNASNPTSAYESYSTGAVTSNTKTGNWTSPNSNVWLAFFCSQPGHFDSGMKGVVKVGSPTGNSNAVFGSTGGSTPGFEFVAVIVGIVGIVAVRVYHKKH